MRVPRADGDRHYITTISPIKDAQGTVLSAVCSSKDITERKRAEEALEESRERYRALSEAAFEAIFISEKGSASSRTPRPSRCSATRPRRPSASTAPNGSRRRTATW